MTVYVDNARIPRKIGRLDTVWSHLTADTTEELHAFADRLGLRRAWFQTCHITHCSPCPHWHYDVTESKRQQAVRLGAVEITLHQLGELIGARLDCRASGMGRLEGHGNVTIEPVSGVEEP